MRFEPGTSRLESYNVDCSSTAFGQTQRENEGFVLHLHSRSLFIHGVAAQLA